MVEHPGDGRSTAVVEVGVNTVSLYRGLNGSQGTDPL